MNVVATIAAPRGGGGSDAIALVALVLLYPVAMLTIQRAHDIGKSTWFGVVALVLGSFASVVGDMDNSDLGVLVIAGIASAIAALVMGIMLAFRRGDVGENEYGPDPLDAEGALACE